MVRIILKVISTVVKAIRSNIKVSPHGGIVPVLKKIKEFGIPQVIRSVMGTRKKQSKYGYEDIFIAWILTALCGGTRLDHITKLKKKLNIIPDLELPSHDTLGRVMKKVASDIETKRNIGNAAGSDVETQYNDNIPLNTMLVKATKASGALKENIGYTLHIDSTFISSECRGAVRKKGKDGKVNVSKIGFNPMTCTINDMPVFISMRDGYANGYFEFNSCLQKCLKILSDENITVDRVISDAAGYNKEAFEMLHSKGIKFLVRFPFRLNMENFKSDLIAKTKWENKEIRTANFIWDCEIGDVMYKMHDRPETRIISPTWRVIAMRQSVEELTTEKQQTKELNIERLAKLSKKGSLKEVGKTYTEGKWTVVGNYKYQFFITNDFEKPSEELIREHQKRGTAERTFSFMKRDFAWRLPPFSNMNENAVFLIAASLANNVFKGIVQALKKFVPGLGDNTRLQEFRFLFVDTACAYIKKRFVFFNTNIAFEKIK